MSLKDLKKVDEIMNEIERTDDIKDVMMKLWLLDMCCVLKNVLKQLYRLNNPEP